MTNDAIVLMLSVTVECVSTAALLARREEALEEKKAAIADIASSLIEAPEDNVNLLTLISTHLKTS